MPVPASAVCDYNSTNYNSGTVNLNPGIYCGGINFNSAVNVNFAPGVYVIRGGNWNIDGGNWTGAGVTFYFADSSKFQFNCGVSANITSPTTGLYAGISIFEAANLAQSPFVLDDSHDMSFDGLIYLPSRDMTFNSGSNLTDKNMTLVVRTLILDQTNWNLQPSANAIMAAGSAGPARLLQ